MKATEPIEVDVSAIHDVDGTGLGHQLIEDIDVVQLAVADEDEGRDIAPQIQERVQLLDEAQLAALGELALRCEKVYGPRRDIIAKDALKHIPAGT